VTAYEQTINLTPILDALRRIAEAQEESNRIARRLVELMEDDDG